MEESFERPDYSIYVRHDLTLRTAVADVNIKGLRAADVPALREKVDALERLLSYEDTPPPPASGPRLKG